MKLIVTCGTHGTRKKWIQVLAEKPQGRRLLGWSWHILKDNIKTHLKQVVSKHVDWTHMAKDNKWQNLVGFCYDDTKPTGDSLSSTGLSNSQGWLFFGVKRYSVKTGRVQFMQQLHSPPERPQNLHKNKRQLSSFEYLLPMCFSTMATHAHNSPSGLLHFFNTVKLLSTIPACVIFLQVLLTSTRSFSYIALPK